MLIILGDSDVVRLEHAVELFKLRGGGVMGDLSDLPDSQLAVLPGTTHLIPPGHGLLDRVEWLLAMISPFLDPPPGGALAEAAAELLELGVGDDAALVQRLEIAQRLVAALRRRQDRADGLLGPAPGLAVAEPRLDVVGPAGDGGLSHEPAEQHASTLLAELALRQRSADRYPAHREVLGGAVSLPRHDYNDA